jgi:hypothetical protein
MVFWFPFLPVVANLFDRVYGFLIIGRYLYIDLVLRFSPCNFDVLGNNENIKQKSCVTAH